MQYNQLYMVQEMTSLKVFNEPASQSVSQEDLGAILEPQNFIFNILERNEEKKL